MTRFRPAIIYLHLSSLAPALRLDPAATFPTRNQIRRRHTLAMSIPLLPVIALITIILTLSSLCRLLLSSLRVPLSLVQLGPVL